LLSQPNETLGKIPSKGSLCGFCEKGRLVIEGFGKGLEDSMSCSLP
jgi:hypothetical protein